MSEREREREETFRPILKEHSIKVVLGRQVRGEGS